MAEDNESDAALLERWQQGDRRAGSALYDRHADYIIRFFRNKLTDRSDIDELVNETFLRVLDRLEHIREGEKFRFFMYGVARNVLREHVRGLGRGRAIDPSVDGLAALQPGPTTVVARKREQRLLLEALRRISLDEQVLLELYYFEGMKANELAELMGTGHSTMRGRLMRARERLKKMIVELDATADIVVSTDDALANWAKAVSELLQ